MFYPHLAKYHRLYIYNQHSQNKGKHGVITSAKKCASSSTRRIRTDNCFWLFTQLFTVCHHRHHLFTALKSSLRTSHGENRRDGDNEPCGV